MSSRLNTRIRELEGTTKLGNTKAKPGDTEQQKALKKAYDSGEAIGLHAGYQAGFSKALVDIETWLDSYAKKSFANAPCRNTDALIDSISRHTISKPIK